MSSANQFVFFESRIQSKFIGVFLLQMVLSIKVGCSCQKLHSQVTFTFLDLFRGFEMLAISYGWVLEIFFFFFFKLVTCFLLVAHFVVE
jgi:hypothetical protein